MLIKILLINLCLFASGLAREYIPEQIHLSLGKNTSCVWVTWMTFSSDIPPTPEVVYVVKYGKNTPQNRLGTSEHFMNGNRSAWIHRVELDNLLPKTIYMYRAGFRDVWSPPYLMKTLPLQDDEEFFPRLGIYADMGLSNGVSIPFLNKNALDYDAILHVGDIAYDLDSENGLVGDRFFYSMDNVFSGTFYQVVAGNHESWNNFSQYDSRFTMIDQASNKMNNHFYSFDLGPIHIVGFNSEFYYWYYDDPVRNLHQTRTQWEWLEKDLKTASSPENRAKRPWIMVMGHRPMYCSTADADDCIFNECVLRKGIPIVNRYGLEDLFYKYGVDIILAGHEHTYERLFPVYNRKVYNGTDSDNPYDNPRAPVHLLVGSAGCPETIDPFVRNPKPWSAKRISEYGVTDFRMLNRTHIHVRQHSTSNDGAIVDEFMIIKTRSNWNQAQKVDL